MLFLTLRKIGEEKALADNVCTWTGFAEPVDGASHGFGQDAQDKMTQGAETTSASQQGPGGGWIQGLPLPAPAPPLLDVGRRS